MKLNYILGWIAVVGGIGVLIAMVIAGILDSEGAQYVIPKVIWTPFIVWWGVKRIKAYNAGKRGVSNER